jgi:hypothetical protein
LDYEDHNWAWNIQGLLRSLETQFFDANAALNLFLDTSSRPPSFTDREAREHDARRRSEIRLALEQEFDGKTSPEHWDDINFEADVRFKRERWMSGAVPREFEHNLPFIYARAFLSALDAFEKLLGVLAKERDVPGEVATLHAQMTEDFPHLRGVRNSIQHIEDRSRGLGAGKNPKPLDLKPIANSLVNAPEGGVLALNCLINSRYGSTMADGHYGEVDVSAESMKRLQKILVRVLHSFKWVGPRRHSPG